MTYARNRAEYDRLLKADLDRVQFTDEDIAWAVPLPPRATWPHTTATSWATERISEAARMGYEVRFKFDFGVLTASYFNGEFFLYSRNLGGKND